MESWLKRKTLVQQPCLICLTTEHSCTRNRGEKHGHQTVSTWTMRVRHITYTVSAMYSEEKGKASGPVVAMVITIKDASTSVTADKAVCGRVF